MNTKLKLALLQHPDPQYVVAQKMGVSETRLSRIIRGRVEPTPDECAQLAELLGLGEQDISGLNTREKTPVTRDAGCLPTKGMPWKPPD